MDGDLPPIARVLSEAPDDAHRLAGSRRCRGLLDVVPHDREDGARPIGERKAPARVRRISRSRTSSTWSTALPSRRSRTSQVAGDGLMSSTSEESSHVAAS